MKTIHQITIKLLENGEIEVNGPIDDKLLFYGMMETAKARIAEYHAVKDRSKVALASPLSLAEIRARNGG